MNFLQTNGSVIFISENELFDIDPYNMLYSKFCTVRYVGKKENLSQLKLIVETKLYQV